MLGHNKTISGGIIPLHQHTCAFPEITMSSWNAKSLPQHDGSLTAQAGPNDSAVENTAKLKKLSEGFVKKD